MAYTTDKGAVKMTGAPAGRGSSVAPAGRMPTGVSGLDDLIDGGLPSGAITVVIGGAGTGKTTFALQLLATDSDAQPGILVAFEECADRLIANTSGFVWGGDALPRSVHVIDAQLSQSVENGGEFDLVGFLAVLHAKAKKIGAQRVVFDGIDVLLDCLGNAALARRELFRLRDWVYQSGLTAILTAKAADAHAAPQAEYAFLQFLADCVVTLHHRTVGGRALRFLQVSKYRGAAHSANEIALAITRMGLEVAANTAGERCFTVSNERVSTGVPRLDAMLSGGYHRGSSVLITGAPGTAKTSLAAAFAEAAAIRGERTVYVSFDEAPQQIVRNAASIGVQLASHVASGMLRIHSLRARSESPEAHIARIRALLDEEGTRNLVIDPLSAMTQAGSETEAEDAAIQLFDLAKGAGVTVVSTSLLGNLTPFLEHLRFRVSTIADTWMHVSYEIRAGERNRSLTVVKSRGTAHSNQVRELILSEAGIALADVYSVDGEVLMGTLRWEKENNARRLREAAHQSAVLRQRKAELALSGIRSQLDALTREQSIQEEELSQLRAETTLEVEHRTGEDLELLQRRHADDAVSGPPLDTHGGSST